MFDFGFSELVVICVVALVVLGPTRLPGVVRKVGRWVGKARAMARDFRQQLENEVNLDELNRMTSEQSRPKPPAPAAEPPTTGSAADAERDARLADSGYPYSAPPTADTGTAPATGEPAAGPDDDTYSHAHAAGAAPEPWSPEADLEPRPAPASEPEPTAEPHPGSADPDPDRRPA